MYRFATDKRSEVQDKLYGCNSVQISIPMFAMKQGAYMFAECTVSLNLGLDDYITPQMDCLQTFMYSVSDFGHLLVVSLAAHCCCLAVCL